MTLQELKYLVAVADHLHFGKAAAACHVTQPTLSAGLRSLEFKLDLILCERGPQGVIMAQESAPLVEQARRILAAVRELAAMADAGRSPLAGVLRLGAIPTIGPYLFPHIIPGLRSRWPGLRLHLVEARTSELLEELRRGDLDAALLSPPVEDSGLDRLILYREEFLLALPPRHPLLKRKRPTVSNLTNEPLLLLDEGHCLRDQVVEFCRIGDTAAREMVRSGSLETLRNMVTAGMGATLLPALALQGGRLDDPAIRHLARPAPWREVGLYWRSGAVHARSLRELAESIVPLLPDPVARRRKRT